MGGSVGVMFERRLTQCDALRRSAVVHRADPAAGQVSQHREVITTDQRRNTVYNSVSSNKSLESSAGAGRIAL